MRKKIEEQLIDKKTLKKVTCINLKYTDLLKNVEWRTWENIFMYVYVVLNMKNYI